MYVKIDECKNGENYFINDIYKFNFLNDGVLNVDDLDRLKNAKCGNFLKNFSDKFNVMKLLAEPVRNIYVHISSSEGERVSGRTLCCYYYIEKEGSDLLTTYDISVDSPANFFDLDLSNVERLGNLNERVRRKSDFNKINKSRISEYVTLADMPQGPKCVSNENITSNDLFLVKFKDLKKSKHFDEKIKQHFEISNVDNVLCVYSSSDFFEFGVTMFPFDKNGKPVYINESILHEQEVVLERFIKNIKSESDLKDKEEFLDKHNVDKETKEKILKYYYKYSSYHYLTIGYEFGGGMMPKKEDIEYRQMMHNTLSDVNVRKYKTGIKFELFNDKAFNNFEYMEYIDKSAVKSIDELDFNFFLKGYKVKDEFFIEIEKIDREDELHRQPNTLKHKKIRM